MSEVSHTARSAMEMVQQDQAMNAAIQDAAQTLNRLIEDAYRQGLTVEINSQMLYRTSGQDRPILDAKLLRQVA